MTTSPCINVCKIDPKTQLCLGCARTIQEIAAWSRLTEAQRKAIVERLAARKSPQIDQGQR